MNRILIAVWAGFAALAAAPVYAATPAEVLAAYSAKAGSAPNAERGRELYNRSFKGGLFTSCAECHRDPLKNGKDQTAEKTIRPLAPAAWPQRFTDAAKVEHQFKLNCKDVTGRDCTAQEKADVLSWLISLKP
jgi:cytochrome c553